MIPPPLPPRRNPVATFFVGLWDVMNFTRRLILNLLFFGLLFLMLLVFVAALGKGSGAKPLHERTTLVIAPEGRLVEQFSTDPVSRAFARAMGDSSAEEIQLRDLLRAIEAAKEDKHIERVLLQLDKLQPSGMASMREVAKALAELGRLVNAWTLKPAGTEGYRTAEVTLGGVATDGLSSKTMAAKAHPGLYFVGEAVDVTGWLGGYNFQWAWSSGWVAGMEV